MPTAPTSGPVASEKMVPTSLKLPADLKAQIDDRARKVGLSAHAFMVKTLGEATERARLREQFDQDTVQAWEALQRDNAVYDFDEARAYFVARSEARKLGAPMPDKPSLKPWRGNPVA